MDSLSKNSVPVFFFLSELSPLAELCPFEISYMDSLSKNSVPVFFFLSELSPLAELCPFEGLKVQICNHDISKTITARSFKLGHLIEDDE